MIFFPDIKQRCKDTILAPEPDEIRSSNRTSNTKTVTVSLDVTTPCQGRRYGPRNLPGVVISLFATPDLNVVTLIVILEVRVVSILP